MEVSVAMNRWKCTNCGYRLEADAPPDKCPSCQQTCGFVGDNCYIPDCGLIETGEDKS